MKTILFGRYGQLGARLAPALGELGEVVAMGRADVDMADLAQLQRIILDTAPDLVVNAAAYTAVDQAEHDYEKAMIINAHAPAAIAETAARIGAVIVQYSTDYVFDGAKGAPYTEEDEPRPLNSYARSKLAGELALQRVNAPHLIFRTSWMYDSRGHSFPLTLLRLAESRPMIKVVDDQRGTPNWAVDLARATVNVLRSFITSSGGIDLARYSALSGVYHLSAPGEVTWCDYARLIMELTHERGRRPVIVPVTSQEFGAAAERPRYSVLSAEKSAKAFGVRLPPWRESLAACIREMVPDEGIEIIGKSSGGKV